MIDMNNQFRPTFLLLLENDKDELFGSFENVEGIELPLGKGDTCDEIRFSNGWLNPPFNEKSNLEHCDVKICICDDSGKPMVFYTGVASQLTVSHAKNSLEVTLSGEYLPFISNGALSLWLERRKGLPVNKGRWIELNSKERQAWLEVSLLDLRKRPAKMVSHKVEIDGKYIEDLNSFLCSFGEAVFGPGGYIGRGMGALNDCLTGGFGVEFPLQLRWTNSKLSEKNFRLKGEGAIYKNLIDLLKEAGVQVIYS